MPRVTKKQQAAQFAAQRGWTSIGENEWTEITAALPGLNAATMEDAGLFVEQPWRGVKQHNFDELEHSLQELTVAYFARPDLQLFIRRQVIAAKDHARWVSRSARVDEMKRHAKAEMVNWMLVWLDDPAMFVAWAERRRAVLHGRD